MLKTEVIRVNPECIEQEKIESIVNVLQEGKIIVYPTDTFYGLGADSFSEEGIRKIYALKQRDFSKPLSVVISDIDALPKIARDIPPLFDSIAREFWPGPLTLIFKASSSVPKAIQGGSGTIGVRLPDHRWLRTLIKQSGFPLVATSANISGEREISSPQRVRSEFFGKVDLIVDGGKTKGGLPSTVLDISGDKPRLLRKGALPASAVEKYLSSHLTQVNNCSITMGKKKIVKKGQVTSF